MSLVGAIAGLALMVAVDADCLRSEYPNYFDSTTYGIESLRVLVEQYPDSAIAVVESRLGLTPPICLARVETIGDGGSLELVLVESGSGEREVRMRCVNSARIIGRPQAPSHLDWKGRLLVGSAEERAALVGLWLCASTEGGERRIAAEVARRIEDQRNACAEVVRVEVPPRGGSGDK